MHAYDMEINFEDSDSYTVGCQCGAVFNVAKNEFFVLCPYCENGVDLCDLKDDWRWRSKKSSDLHVF